MKTWMLTMPRLTGDILLKEAEAMSLMLHGQMVNLSSEQWDGLEERCRVRLRWPEDWKERRWKKCYKEVLSTGWGTRFGPELLGEYSSSSHTVKRAVMYRQKKKPSRRKPQVTQEEKLF